MALVSKVSTAEAAETVRPTLEGMERKIGSVPSIFGVMAHTPEMLQGFLALNGALSKTKLESKLRELAYMKASQLNHCDYCLRHHQVFGDKAGLSTRQIEEIDRFEESDAYDDLQRDVLRYAEQVTRHINVSPELVSRLRASLSEREVVELAMAVAIANLTNRFTETLKLEFPDRPGPRGCGMPQAKGPPIGPVLTCEMGRRHSSGAWVARPRRRGPQGSDRTSDWIEEGMNHDSKDEGQR